MARKIAYVTDFFSDGMGYTENCLPPALQKLGYDIQTFCSNLQVYGMAPDYDATYGAFLGPRVVVAGSHVYRGVQVNRLAHRRVGRYVGLPGLVAALHRFGPDIVQVNAPVSPVALRVALAHASWKLYTECHQHLSVAAPLSAWSSTPGQLPRLLAYRLTRTLPGRFVAARTVTCFAVAPDCATVATSHYGVPAEKVVQIPLGTDAVMFHPVHSIEEKRVRESLRLSWGVGDDYVVVVYSGRLSHAKSPILLGQAVQRMAEAGERIIAVFVGDGEEKMVLSALTACRVLPFAKQDVLADIYRAADMAAWPSQESMSMLDAMASGLAIVVSDKMGDQDRVEVSGLTYEHGSIESLTSVLKELMMPETRVALGERAQAIAVKHYSWDAIARQRSHYYEGTLAPWRQ